ncbi:hypothetical protein SVIOM342S_06450 [Streptomyces violaceorubidus]
MPRQNTSLAQVTSSPLTCSGDMKPGEPAMCPVPVRESASTLRTMPKSMTRGPSSASSTLEGLRSRWTRCAAWIDTSASASPAASVSTARGSNGPRSATACSSDGPAM